MKKLFFSSIILFPFLSYAAYHTSGYISLQYLSGTTYQATIMDYTIGDPQNSGFCGTTNDRDTIRLNWGDGTSDLLYRSNGGGDSVCECRKVNIYTAIHTFPGPGTYRLCYDAIGRDAGIYNMINSVAQDMLIFYTLTIVAISLDTISYPAIMNPPICSYGCPTQCYYFNLGAAITGGDSLSYSLGNCLPGIGYYIPSNAIIDPVSGELSWCNPDTIGLYNFAILITTYKRVVISSNPVLLVLDTEEVELQVNVDFNCSLGINELANNNVYSIYPDPAKDIVYISGTDENDKLITVYNMVGQTLISVQEKQEQFTINTSGLSEGVYFVNIKEKQSGRSYTLKLVKD